MNDEVKICENCGNPLEGGYCTKCGYGASCPKGGCE